jgi:hypothetical protein
MIDTAERHEDKWIDDSGWRKRKSKGKTKTCDKKLEFQTGGLMP